MKPNTKLWADDRKEDLLSSLVTAVSLANTTKYSKRPVPLDIDVTHPRFRAHLFEAFGERSAEFSSELLQALFTLWWAGVREGDLLTQ